MTDTSAWGEPNADGTFTLTWLTGYVELPTYRTVMDLDAGRIYRETLTPGRTVSEAEYRSGLYVAPVDDPRVRVIQGGESRLLALEVAAKLAASSTAAEPLERPAASRWDGAVVGYMAAGALVSLTILAALLLGLGGVFG